MGASSSLVVHGSGCGGVNLTGASGVPPKESAARIAQDLARLGFNLARFHHLDTDWGNGILLRTNHTRLFDPNLLDRFDYFVAELKQRGIYVSLTMNVLRKFKEGDGVRDASLLGYGKGGCVLQSAIAGAPAGVHPESAHPPQPLHRQRIPP